MSGAIAATGGLDPVPLLSAVPVDRIADHWWVFPASVLFSLVAVAAGVSGALFFSPFFLLAVGLGPAQAVGAGLLTEVFGMGNGLRSYVKQGVVDYATGKWLLLGALPAIVIGAFAANSVPDTLLRGGFGVGLFALGGFLLYSDSPEETEPGEREGEFLGEKNAERGTTVVDVADGQRDVIDTDEPGGGVALGHVRTVGPER